MDSLDGLNSLYYLLSPFSFFEWDDFLSNFSKMTAGGDFDMKYSDLNFEEFLKFVLPSVAGKNLAAIVKQALNPEPYSRRPMVFRRKLINPIGYELKEFRTSVCLLNLFELKK